MDIMQLKIVEVVLEDKELLDREEDVKFDKLYLTRKRMSFLTRRRRLCSTRRWKLWLTIRNRRMLIVIRSNDTPCE